MGIACHMRDAGAQRSSVIMNVPDVHVDFIVGPRVDWCRDRRTGHVVMPPVGALGHDPLERPRDGWHCNAAMNPWGAAPHIGRS
eukprot:3443831-Alexandrium_andersonii.AAC.1